MADPDPAREPDPALEPDGTSPDDEPTALTPEPGATPEPAGTSPSDAPTRRQRRRALEPDGTSPSHERPRGHRRRRVLLGLAAFLLLLVVAAGWLALEVYRAGTALSAAQASMPSLSGSAGAGDQVSQLTSTLPALTSDLQRARGAVSSPVWSAALVVPWLGDQLRAVRTVTVALDDVANAGGPALDAIQTVLDTHAAAGGGRLELTPLIDAMPALVNAADKVKAASSAVAGIDAGRLTGRLADPVRRIQTKLASVAGLADSGSRLGRLLPAFLGADGPRTYVLVSLNSAELRAQGGIVGALALLRVDNGTIEIVDQRTTGDFPALDQPVLPLTPQELTLQSDRLGRWVQDATMAPDFPRAAQLIAARWAAQIGQHVDGVIATDPVAAAALLRATGPVTDPSGMTLSADNLIPELLHNTYLRADAAAGDRFYAGVAKAIFQAVGDGQGDRRAVLDALAKVVGQGRMRVWSADDGEESQLTRSTVGGAFLTGGNAAAAGVFLDDGTAGKLDYYLTTKVSVEKMVCTGATPTATIRIDLAYNAPADVASQPWYVTGVPTSALPTGWLATNLSVYSPVGAQLGTLGLDAGYVSGLTGSVDGRAVQVVTSRLAPGGHATYTAVVPVQGGSLTVWSTPTLTSDGFVTATCGQ